MNVTISNRGTNGGIRFFSYSKVHFSYDDWGAIELLNNHWLMYFKKPLIFTSIDPDETGSHYSLDSLTYNDAVEINYKFKSYNYAVVSVSKFMSWFSLTEGDMQTHYGVDNTANPVLQDVEGYTSFFDLSYSKPWIVTSDVFDVLKPTDDELGINPTTLALFANNMKPNDSRPSSGRANGSIPVYRNNGPYVPFYFNVETNTIDFTAWYAFYTPMVSMYPFNTIWAWQGDRYMMGTIVFTGVDPL